MYYPDDILREVRERTDIVSVISRYVTLTRKGRNYFGLCPFHGEKTASFSVNPGEQFYHCFGCGAGGNVFTFLQNIENISFGEAVEKLAEEAHVALPQAEMSPREKARRERRQKMQEANRDAALFYYTQLVKSPYAAEARRYLEGRQVSMEYLKKFGLGYAPIARDALCGYLLKKGYPEEMLRALNLASGEGSKMYDRFFNRVMFPIFDPQGKVIAFGGRVIGKGEPKYLNSSDTELFNKRKNLYAMNLAKKTRRKQALMVEGYMDVFSLHQAGFDNAVASLGTALTTDQALLLKRYFEEVCLIYDSDAAGTNAAKRAIPILEQAGLRVRVLRVPGAKDPDEYVRANGAEAFEEQIEHALDPVEFEMAVSNMATVDGRVEVLSTMRERLAHIENDAERELHIRDVAKRLEISPATLAKEVDEVRRTAGMREYEEARAQVVRRRDKGRSALDNACIELLACLVHVPGLRKAVAAVLPEEDIPETPPYREVYRYLLAQGSRVVLAADLFGLSDEEEAHSRLVAIGAQNLPEETAEIVKMTTENLRMIRQVAIDEKLKSVADVEEMQRLMATKKALETQFIQIQS